MLLSGASLHAQRCEERLRVGEALQWPVVASGCDVRTKDLGGVRVVVVELQLLTWTSRLCFFETINLECGTLTAPYRQVRYVGRWRRETNKNTNNFEKHIFAVAERRDTAITEGSGFRRALGLGIDL